MKYIKALIVCLIFVNLLAACESQKDDQELPSEQSPTEELSIEDDQIITPQTELAEVITLEEDRDTLRVLWTVSDFVIVDEETEEKRQEALKYLFSELDIDDDEICFNGQVCKGVRFEEEIVNIGNYLDEFWGVNSQMLGLLNNLDTRIITTNCPMFGFRSYMHLEDGRLIVPFEGVFYFFDPNVDY